MVEFVLKHGYASYATTYSVDHSRGRMESLNKKNHAIVEREVSNFHNDCALPDTSMTLSAYVLQTFLIMKSILANAIFSIFKMATLIFKMAAKLIII